MTNNQSMIDTPQAYPVTCPYCWETFSISIEMTADGLSFIADCRVCCHPIQFHATIENNEEILIHAERA